MITSLPAWLITLFLTLFTYFLTALGSSVVFLFKNVKQSLIDFMLSFSAGIMFASGVFSLLIPSIEYSQEIFEDGVFIPTLSFLFGAFVIILFDVILNKLLKNKDKNNKINKKNIILFSAITLHNIPEGMCVGVAVALASLTTPFNVMPAFLLALGVGIQNFPEGASISLPMKAGGESSKKAFYYGQMSGIVEPIFGVIACLFAIYFQWLLPFLLAFSAGAMICVSATELIADAVINNKYLAGAGIIIGFCFMMLLDLLF